MRLTKENKRKIHDRIVRNAAALLRSEGYGNVNLDQIMQAAGLTRGAFYAHFPSKAALFAEIVRSEHPLLTKLRQRPGKSAPALWQQLRATFDAYLDPAHQDRIFAGCTLAALTGDVSRSAAPVRRAYEDALADIVAEMGRGQSLARPEVLAGALVLATQAVTAARACASIDQKAALLSACQKSLDHLLRQAGADASPEHTGDATITNQRNAQ